MTISGNGKQVRDLLHAEDMKKLYLAAVQNIHQAKGQVFNIGGGVANGLSLLELFHFLEEELKIKLNYQKLQPRQSDQKIFIADITKAKELLGWEPTVSYDKGIRQMLAWLDQHD
jgi:CDP-paratose 2-epimerase